MFEPVYGFRSLKKDGIWVEPDGVLISTQEEFQNFVLESILDHHEIRVVSEDKEYTNFHVINKELLYPKPDGLENVKAFWDPIIGKFIPEGVTRPETEGEKLARDMGIIK